MLQLPRRLSSNANPVRKYPKTLSAVQKKDESVAPTESSVRTMNESSSHYVYQKPYIFVKGEMQWSNRHFA